MTVGLKRRVAFPGTPPSDSGSEVASTVGITCRVPILENRSAGLPPPSGSGSEAVVNCRLHRIGRGAPDFSRSAALVAGYPDRR